MLEVVVGNRLQRHTRSVLLRELTGHDELAMAGSGVTAASEQIGRLIVASAETSSGAGAALPLPLTDRDQIVARLHADCFGDRIESIVECGACSEPTSVEFSLGAMLDDLLAPAGELQVTGPTPTGITRSRMAGAFGCPPPPTKERRPRCRRIGPRASFSGRARRDRT